MSGILLSSSASESSSSSSDSPSDSPASTGSSTPSISGRLSPLPEAGLEGGGPLPIRALTEVDRAALDLGGPSFYPLGAGADRFGGSLDHSVDLDDVMLIFGTEEVRVEEAGGSPDWMLTEVIVKERGEGSRADACQVGEKGISKIEVVDGGNQVMSGPGGKSVGCGEALQAVSEAEEKGEAEEEYVAVEEDWAERNWAEEQGWAERCRLGELVQTAGTSSGEVERYKVVAEEGGEAEGETEAVGEGEAEGCQEIVRHFVGEKMGSVAEGFYPCTSATDLVDFLGLGSSSDTEEDELCMGKAGVEESLAIVAEKRQCVEVEGSSSRFGQCESEGLTEEMGAIRREMGDPGMLDDEWRQKTLAFNGEGIANSIYHIPKGYRLHLPPEGSFIHDPTEGHVEVYLKHLEFGLRFPLADEIV